MDEFKSPFDLSDAFKQMDARIRKSEIAASENSAKSAKFRGISVGYTKLSTFANVDLSALITDWNDFSSAVTTTGFKIPTYGRWRFTFQTRLDSNETQRRQFQIAVNSGGSISEIAQETSTGPYHAINMTALHICNVSDVVMFRYNTPTAVYGSVPTFAIVELVKQL